MYILCHYHLYLLSISSICTFLGKTAFFVSFKQILFCNFFLCPLKFLASPFLLNIRSFLSVFSRLFINLYIVIKSPLCLLSFSVVRCISFNLSSYVRSSLPLFLPLHIHSLIVFILLSFSESVLYLTLVLKNSLQGIVMVEEFLYIPVPIFLPCML